MGEQLGTGQIGRRDLLKKGAVAGGLVWAAPMVFSASAGAAVIGACTDCPSDKLFGIKFNNGTGLEALPANSNGNGNCLQASASAPPECFEDYFSFASSANGQTHTWTLSPSLQLCQAAAKVGHGTTGGEGCFVCPTATVACGPGGESRITVTSNASGTTVTITDPALSHSEILFCYRGSPNGCIRGA